MSDLSQSMKICIKRFNIYRNYFLAQTFLRKNKIKTLKKNKVHIAKNSTKNTPSINRKTYQSHGQALLIQCLHLQYL